MKIIQLLLLIIPVTIFGQKEFAPLNTVWNYEGHDLDCNGNHVNYVVEKEEIFDGRDCSVIYAYTSSNLSQNFIKSHDSLIVWEDDNKIYFLEDSTFYLLFDFDVNIGDTVTYYEPINKSEFSTNQVIDISQGPNEYQIIITQMENVSISNMSLRKYYTEIISPDGFQFLQSSIIENIGSLSQNFTGDQAFYVADGCFGGLQCYNNGQIQYKSEFAFETPNPSCEILDSTNELNENSAIRVYPNPASTKIKIESEDQIKSIEIRSIDGTLCLKTNHHSDMINIEEFIPGIYLISIGMTNGIQTVKFVKE